jgi:hypothetical protein
MVTKKTIIEHDAEQNVAYVYLKYPIEKGEAKEQ